ncbi:MAG: DUF4093 domain-containing protein [Eubacteriales bacterium]|nr:DUF4093 domain-containing protein [Eubacteriales bacterium]
MYRVKEAIIVEGVYDKIKLSSFIDGIIMTTGGFSIFNNKKAQSTIRTLAEKTGIVILSDSDSAGIKIRNFIKQLAPDSIILHAYVPEIKGREKRKEKDSAEGLLGVEGMTEDIIIDAIRKSGATVDDKAGVIRSAREITKADMFLLGLSGGNDSSLLRQEISKKLGLPSKLSANMLLDCINRLLTFDELSSLVEDIKQ